MKNRIEELAKQSGIALGNNYAEGSRRDLLEKFAQLIALECANHIMTSTDRHRREYFATMIKKHFGIEE